MPISSFSGIAALSLMLLAGTAAARRESEVGYAPPAPIEVMATVTPGAIFRGTFAPLSSGYRAGQVGDVLTVVLTERTDASHSNTVTTDRDGSIGFSPPVTGPLSFISSSDVKMGGGTSFKGKGQSAQSNALNGEISVTVIAVRNNGTLVVRGEKSLSFNRDDERITLSGIVRSSDISPDNRVASTRIADARIGYSGKGAVARAGRPGWLQRFFSAVSPF